MEFIKKNPKIYILSGCAQSGKNETAKIIKEYYEKNNKKTVILAYAKYLKDYIKEITNWDGEENTKPRELLQQLGTNIIREELGKDDLFINRMIDDIDVYSCFYDAVIISDVRFKKEIWSVKKAHPEAISIHMFRPNFDNGLTEEQKKHKTEIDLDDFNEFDEEIINTTFDNLKEDAKRIYTKYER